MRFLFALVVVLAVAGCGFAPNETTRFAFTRGLTVASESSDSAGTDAGFTTRFRSNEPVADVVAKARRELTSAAGWTETTETGQLTLDSPTWTTYVFQKSGKNGNLRISISEDPAGRAATYVSIRQRVSEDRML